MYFDLDKFSFPVKRNFTVSGIYETGFNEYDENYGFVDVRHLQKINKWNSNQYGGIEIFYKKILIIVVFQNFYTIICHLI